MKLYNYFSGLGKISVIFALCSVFSIFPARADLSSDTEDPMFLEAGGDLSSRTGLDFSHNVARVTQKVAYGINGNMAFGADIGYQQDLDGQDDGFSNVGLNLMYRSNNGPVKSDLFGGMRFVGDSRVSDFAKNVYYAGVRVGRQWDYITLAGTVKTSWIFDNLNGMAFIDLSPEVYFRMIENWSAGVGFTMRKVTNSVLDTEWVTVKLGRRYGRTMYVGSINYDLESSDCWFGGNVNVLF